ncbi:hypothetical protein GWI33_018361 [Rhynchophorus ferrugineus]|uniref:Coiled-coil domain-containing protein R3HCC1L n=1 Tax=Rhynchophorus ferrugineus TaxID=354439 RepID=A0A834HTH7_RHYFE|nr:hypothetical protein GWI33_018361 [Rhynchophorus ferrugineus]
MNSRSIDEILSKLSIKFNRIFCEKEFVCCVCEDLQIIIKNKDKCCVLVFPTLNPNYLRVVRYQAKLLDLAVISLGSGSAKSIGVCHKKYILGNTEPEETCSKKPSNNLMAENSTNARKKRPPIQLYVPPAQRKSRQNEINSAQKVTHQNTQDTDFSTCPRKEITKKQYSGIQSVSENEEVKRDENTTSICYCTEDIDCLYNNFPYFNIGYNFSKLIIFKDLFFLAKLLIFNIKRIKHSYHWLNWKLHNGLLTIYQNNIRDYPLAYCQKYTLKDNDVQKTKCSNLLPKSLILPSQLIDDDKDINKYNYFVSEKQFIFDLNNFEINNATTKPCLHCYLTSDHGSLQKDEFIKILSTFNINQSLLPRNLDEFILECLNQINLTDNSSKKALQIDLSEKTEKTSETKSTNPSNKKEHVIVLDERIEPIPKSPQINEPVQIKKNEHEQEKEIMRKAKQNINRKTRPIIKYVENDDTLKIGKNDNVNNWEDLFGENGELEDDIFTEIVQKVGSNVTIVKAEEDYTAYASKQIEELEHMVELYDFPSTFETNDLISAFSQLNSDSMYVKWVDDTHAILVLGSYTQAQKAIELSNTLIKVRPMSAASRLSLEKAHQFDLKPAMKRPQTNLQTARRLITSHLGAKSQISKEQSAKEREDLRVAKEMKKQARQNERDAWEGNLRSRIK